MSSILDFSLFVSPHVLLMFISLSESCSLCSCAPSNSPQTPQRKSMSCDSKCLHFGFLQVVVILIKEEIEICFEHFVPFSFKDWADFKKCWHAIKVREQPTLSDGLNAHFHDRKDTSDLLQSFFVVVGDTKYTMNSLQSSDCLWTFCDVSDICACERE